MKKTKLKVVDMIRIKYTDLPGGFPSWQDPSLTRPRAFDLVELKTPKKIVAGWWTGNAWMGLRLRKGEKIISWKRSRELDFI